MSKTTELWVVRNNLRQTQIIEGAGALQDGRSAFPSIKWALHRTR